MASVIKKMKTNKLNKFFLLVSLTLSSLLMGCSSMAVKDQSPVDEDKKITATNADIQLGMNYLQTKDVSLAKEKFLAALDLTPNYSPAWYAMAYYLEVTGDNAKANEYYLHAISLAPRNGDVQNNYGTFLCHTGKAKESIPHFLQATQDPNYLETGAAYENAGLCALLIPDTKAAKEYFSKALMQDPSRVLSLTKLAEIDYQQKNYQDAEDLLQRAIKIAPSDENVLSLSVRVEEKLKNPKKAQ